MFNSHSTVLICTLSSLPNIEIISDNSPFCLHLMLRTVTSIWVWTRNVASQDWEMMALCRELC